MRLSRNCTPRHDVSFAYGDGAMFWDLDGRGYIDLSSQTMNLLFGQKHPHIHKAIFDALERCTFIDQDFISPEYTRALEALSPLLPTALRVCNLRMNDGSSAVECAVKQARRRTGRSRVLTTRGIYLGQTTQTINLRGLGIRPYDLLNGSTEDVVFAPIPYPEDGLPLSQAPNENGDALADLIVSGRRELACVILDPIMISSGVTGGRDMGAFLRRAAEACRAASVPLIFDECQSFGWVPDMTLATHFGIDVDLLVLGKAIGGGLPLAACAMKEEFDLLEFGEADFTNGGTIAAIAGLRATCELLASPAEDQHFQKLCDCLDQELAALESSLPRLIRTRGIGLIRAIEIRAGEQMDLNVALAKRVSLELLHQGIYVRRHGACLSLKPPRVTSQATLQQGLSGIHTALFDLNRQLQKESAASLCQPTSS